MQQRHSSLEVIAKVERECKDWLEFSCLDYVIGNEKLNIAPTLLLSAEI